MLENKKTNIKWISSIPKEWKMGRLKDVIEVLTDYTANG